MRTAAAIVFWFLAMDGLSSKIFAETPQSCVEGMDFKSEFERIFLSYPNVVAKCEVPMGTVIHLSDPFGPSPNSSGSLVSEGTTVILSDKLDVVDGIVYLRRYVPKGWEDCGEIDDLPSHVLLEQHDMPFPITSKTITKPTDNPADLFKKPWPKPPSE